MKLLNILVRISRFGLVPVFSFSQTTRSLTSRCCLYTLEPGHLWGCLLTRKAEAKWRKSHCLCGKKVLSCHITALLVLGVTCSAHILQGVCMYTVCSGLSLFIHFGLKLWTFCVVVITRWLYSPLPHIIHQSVQLSLFQLPRIMFWLLTYLFPLCSLSLALVFVGDTAMETLLATETQADRRSRTFRQQSLWLDESA